MSAEGSSDFKRKRISRKASDLLAPHIRTLAKEGLTQKAIAGRVGVGEKAVRRVLSEDPSISEEIEYLPSPEEIRAECLKIRSSWSAEELLERWVDPYSIPFEGE